MQSLHEGHRKRMKERFLQSGLEAFETHNILELLLFYGIPRKDTNEIAHRLEKAFGSFSNVLDAPFEELIKIEGMGESAAILLKLIPAVCREYMDDKYSIGTIINSTERAGEFLIPKFIGRNNEIVYIICLDNKCKVINSMIAFEGSVNAASVSVRNLVEIALRSNATSVIIAHNHPSGIAIPSFEDIETTQKLIKAFDTVEIKLLDHIIIAEHDFVSLADSGQFSNMFGAK